MSFTFGFGERQDIDQVTRLLDDCQLPAEGVAQHIEHFVIARSGDSLAGTIALEPAGPVALLRSLAVAPQYRRQGLATSLYERIVAYAQTRGIETLYLLTLSARDFFTRRGFAIADRSSAPEEIAATREFSNLCPDSATFMVKDLHAPSDRTLNVLFLCTGNSARSIMAEAILNAASGGGLRAFSAGSHPNGKVNPFALAQIRKNGLPADHYRSKSWDDFCQPSAPKMDIVITVCSQAAGEVCPVWPGQPLRAHWGVEDPAAFEGTDQEKNSYFETIYNQLAGRIRRLTSVPLDKLDRASLQRKLDEIGRA